MGMITTPSQTANVGIDPFLLCLSLVGLPGPFSIRLVGDDGFWSGYCALASSSSWMARAKVASSSSCFCLFLIKFLILEPVACPTEPLLPSSAVWLWVSCCRILLFTKSLSVRSATIFSTKYCSCSFLASSSSTENVFEKNWWLTRYYCCQRMLHLVHPIYRLIPFSLYSEMICLHYTVVGPLCVILYFCVLCVCCVSYERHSALLFFCSLFS